MAETNPTSAPVVALVEPIVDEKEEQPVPMTIPQPPAPISSHMDAEMTEAAVHSSGYNCGIKLIDIGLSHHQQLCPNQLRLRQQRSEQLHRRGT